MARVCCDESVLQKNAECALWWHSMLILQLARWRPVLIIALSCTNPESFHPACCLGFVILSVVAIMRLLPNRKKEYWRIANVGFTHFLPKSDQPWVREVIKTHMDAAAAAKQNGQQAHSLQRTIAGGGLQPLRPQQQNRAQPPPQQQQQQQQQPAQQQNKAQQQQPQPQRPMQQQKPSFGGQVRNPQLQSQQQNAQKLGSGPQHPQKQQQQQQQQDSLKRARETPSSSAGRGGNGAGAAQATNKGGGGVGGGAKGAGLGKVGGAGSGLGKIGGGGAGLGKAGGGGAVPPRASMEPAPKRPRVAGASTLSASGGFPHIYKYIYEYEYKYEYIYEYEYKPTVYIYMWPMLVRSSRWTLVAKSVPGCSSLKASESASA
eukprot:1160535-Pelagomonas_calceolata.AAC.15